ncbi:MAG TPA: C39 family peptidase [Anaerolineae bacterium]
MSNRTKGIILLIIGVQFVFIAGLLVLPGVVQAIPGRYRVALEERSPFLSSIAEGVMGAVAPTATALPAPVGASQSQVDIAALIGSQPTATEEATAIPAESDGEDETTAAPTEEPTATPSPTPEPTQTATPTPEPPPPRVLLTGIQAVRQSFNNCGPANLTTVLNFHGYDITQEQIASYLKPNIEDRNVSPWQIEAYVNDQIPGHRAIARSGGTLEMVKQFVAAGIPVVLEKGYEPNTANAPGWWGHYLTVFGHDDELQEFYGMDSFLGPFDSSSGRADSYENIARYWQHFNYTFYVVYKPEQEETVHAILGPQLVDDLTMWRQAAARAQAEVEADPDNAFAWFNLGTSLTRLGEQSLEGNQEYYEAGAQAFDRARTAVLPPRMLWYEFRLYTAYRKVGRYDDVIALANAVLETQGGRNVEETYYYKGLALAEMGDLTAARDNFQEALNVNRNFSPAQVSLDWVNSLLGS